MTIIWTHLERAIIELDDFLAQPKNKYLIAGTVQCFEFTFELAWKMMQRVLKFRGVDTGSPMQVLRAAHKEGIVEDLDLWLKFLKYRNLTVHTYNQDTADAVYQIAQEFAVEVKQIRHRVGSIP